MCNYKEIRSSFVHGVKILALLVCFGFISKHCLAEHVHISAHVGAACSFREEIHRFNFNQLLLQAINPAQESAFDGVGDKGSVGSFSLHVQLLSLPHK